MNLPFLLCQFFIAFTCLSCNEASPKQEKQQPKPLKTIVQEVAIDSSLNQVYAWEPDYQIKDKLINRIAPPVGFERVEVDEKGQAAWLRNLPLLPEGHQVKLYNDELKWNQKAHFAVVNLDVGRRDLQQCADAVMRLKAEYHFAKGEYSKIHFNFTSGDQVSFDDWRYGRKPSIQGNSVRFSDRTGTADNSYSNFKKYLVMIFSYAGTASLEKELEPVETSDLKAGDVFIQAGFPGHAVYILDVAKHPESGKTAFLLGQSYMPAQEFHILRNPHDQKHNPWYILEDLDRLDTPEWGFELNDLMRFSEE
ncbi:MAG: DUF4846 domain-containing protein [Bacteroidota bacterium]